MKKISVFLLLGLVATNCFAKDDIGHKKALAEGYRNNGQYVQAEKGFVEIIAQYPDTDHAFDAHKQLLLLYIQWDRHEKVQSNFEQFTQNFATNPKLPDAIYELGTSSHDWLKYDKAKNFFSYILENHPKNPKAIWAHGSITASDLASTANTKEIQQRIDELRKNYKSNKELPAVLHRIAMAYSSTTMKEKAKELYKDIIKTWPNGRYARLSKAELKKLSKGDVTTVTMIPLTTTKEVAPISVSYDTPALVYSASEKFFAAGDYDKAKELYEYVIEHWPANGYCMSSQLGIARLNVRNNDDAEVARIVEKVIEDFAIYPGLHSDVYRIGKMYYEKAYKLKKEGSEKDARANFLKAIAIFEKINNLPSSTTSYYSYHLAAESCKALLENEKAKQLYDYTINDWPERMLIIASQYYDAGLEASKQGDIDKASYNFTICAVVAEEIIQRLAETDYGRHAYYLAAESYRNLGEFHKAIAYYKYLSLKLPGPILQIAEKYYTDASKQMDEVLDDKTRPMAQAAVDLGELLEGSVEGSVTPEVLSNYYCWMGDCYSMLENYEKSSEKYQKVVDKFPEGKDRWHALFMVGRNYETMKRKELISSSKADKEITQAYRQILSDYPDSKAANHARVWLDQ